MMKLGGLFWLLCAFFPLPLLAAGDSCAQTCVINADCGVGGYCGVNKICQPKAHSCANERWALNERGESSNCDAYQCQPSSGYCLRAAQSSDDCTYGYLFDGVKSCVSSVNCNPQEPACQDLLLRWLAARAEYEKRTPQPKVTPLTCIACDPQNLCESNQMCWQNRCVTDDFFCLVDAAGGHYVSSKQGPQSYCGNYVCDQASSQCFSHCLKSQDCRKGLSCIEGLCL